MTTVPHPSKRQATTERKPPEPTRVYQTYQAECAANGQWGAYRRTGDRYGRSDEWARKTIKKYLDARSTPPAIPSTPQDELAYVPPPGAYPEPQPRLQSVPAAPGVRHQVANQEPVLRRAITLEPPTTLATQAPELPTAEGDITAVANEETANCQPAAAANSQPVEREGEAESPPPNSQPLAAPQDLLDEPVEDPRSLPQDTGTVVLPDAAPLASLLDEALGAAPLVMRQVVRIPVERRPAGLVAWLQEHEVARQQLIAVAVFLVLVALTWLG